VENTGNVGLDHPPEGIRLCGLRTCPVLSACVGDHYVDRVESGHSGCDRGLHRVEVVDVAADTRDGFVSEFVRESFGRNMVVSSRSLALIA
jgi:hypothetical protein